MMTLSEPYTIVERGGYDWFVFKDRDAILEQYRRGEISKEMAAHKLNEGFVVLAPPKEKFFGSMYYNRKRGWHVRPVHRCHGGPHG
jgi:hypothetical protein